MSMTLYAETYHEYALLKARQKKLGQYQKTRIIYQGKKPQGRPRKIDTQ